MMTYEIYRYNNRKDPKPGWWTAERMDYCDNEAVLKSKKVHKRFIHLLTALFV